MRKELKLSGSGGQGLITAGVILAAAGMLDGKEVTQSQSYGPEARGGASKTDVMISDSPIDFIRVQNCDMLLCLTQVSYDRYGKDPVVCLIIDESLKINDSYPKPERIVKVPILATAIQKIGKPMVSNIVALGAVNAALNLVSRESLEKAVLERVPKGTEDLNKRALEAGYELVK